MKRRPLAAVLAAVLCLTLCAAQAWAEVIRAVFFPDAAELTERDTLALTGPASRPTATFRLPIQADPATVAVTPPKGLSVADITWERKEKARRGQGQVLRDQLDVLRRRKAGLDAQIQALAARVEFWKGHAAVQSRTPQEATGLAQTLTADVERALTGKYDLDRAAADLALEIKALEERLARTAGLDDAAWEVSVSLAPTQAKSAALAWSYRMTGCGWQPICRLDARPSDRTVHFSNEAEIWQGSGLDLAQAEVALATLPRSVNTDPPPLPEWIIQPRPEHQPMAKSRAAAPAMMAAPMADNMMEAAAAPVYAQRGTIGLWEAGKRDIPAGEKVRLPLTEAVWNAEFSWVLRPGLDNRAFLRAEVKLADPVDLPPSQGLFLVGGAMLAKRPFSLSGTEARIFFGPDPLVTAKERLLDKKSGETGIIGKKQTFAWDYAFEITNAKSQAVPLRLEVPRPQSRDERIEVSVTAEPKPEAPAKDEESLLVWKLAPKPGEKVKVGLQVRATAPTDMKVDTGRR